MSKKKDKLAIGYALACANIVSLHDETTIASDVLREMFDCRKDVYALNDWCEYDRESFKKTFDENSTKWPYRRAIKEKEDE